MRLSAGVFEAAVAMAVARELGFDTDAVTWVRTALSMKAKPRSRTAFQIGCHSA